MGRRSYVAATCAFCLAAAASFAALACAVADHQAALDAYAWSHACPDGSVAPGCRTGRAGHLYGLRP